MLLDFGPIKSLINQARHQQISLDFARSLDWATGRVAPAKTVNGEVRWKLLARHDDRLYAVIFTIRGDVFWMISVRPASRKERCEDEHV
jgi:uncharacterized DUF497 family protein